MRGEEWSQAKEKSRRRKITRDRCRRRRAKKDSLGNGLATRRRRRLPNAGAAGESRRRSLPQTKRRRKSGKRLASKPRAEENHWKEIRRRQINAAYKADIEMKALYLWLISEAINWNATQYNVGRKPQRETMRRRKPEETLTRMPGWVRRETMKRSSCEKERERERKLREIALRKKALASVAPQL